MVPLSMAKPRRIFPRNIVVPMLVHPPLPSRVVHCDLVHQRAHKASTRISAYSFNCVSHPCLPMSHVKR